MLSLLVNSFVSSVSHRNPSLFTERSTFQQGLKDNLSVKRSFVCVCMGVYAKTTQLSGPKELSKPAAHNKDLVMQVDGE